MEEWIAIDLHMHTVAGVTRDGRKDNVVFSYEDFQKVIAKYKMKLMAVTNHNIVDFTNYILMRHIGKICGTNILLGVELDTNLINGAAIHIATIFNDAFTENLLASKTINDMTTKKKAEGREVFYSNDEIIKLLSNFNILMIPHGNKDKGIFKNADATQIHEALKKISEGFIRIFDSPSDWKLAHIKEYLSSIGEKDLDVFGGVLFSDNRNWKKYDENFRDFYMNAEPTFKGLIHATSNPTKRFSIKNEISKNSNYIAKILLTNSNDDGRIIDSEINLKSGYNCIIGKSGSGKSLLLYLIEKTLLRDKDDLPKYSFSENIKIDIYNENGKILDPNIINLSIGANLFDKIIKASSTNDNNDFYEIIRLLEPNFVEKEVFVQFKKAYNEKLSNYFELNKQINKNMETLIADLNTFEANVKTLNELSLIRIFDISPISLQKESYSDEIIESYGDFQELCSNLLTLSDSYIGEYQKLLQNKIFELRKLFVLSQVDMKNMYFKEKLINKKVEIINNAIQIINGKKSSQAKTKSKLQAEFASYRGKITNLVLNIYLDKLSKNYYDFRISAKDINCKKHINGRKDVIVEEFVDENSLSQISENENYLFKTRGYKKDLSSKVYNMADFTESKELINKYIDVGMLNEEFKLLETFNPIVKVMFDNQDIRELNPGNISKKYIQLYFEEQVMNTKNNVVVFDQIENDVDKEFISKTIKELIEKTKGVVQLIIVTHDPIVAVNADPNNYIESTKVGDKFKYRNFVAESSERDELTTIASNVDGSKEVIRGRYEIYEGDKIYGR